MKCCQLSSESARGDFLISLTCSSSHIRCCSAANHKFAGQSLAVRFALCCSCLLAFVSQLLASNSSHQLSSFCCVLHETSPHQATCSPLAHILRCTPLSPPFVAHLFPHPPQPLPLVVDSLCSSLVDCCRALRPSLPTPPHVAAHLSPLAMADHDDDVDAKMAAGKPDAERKEDGAASGHITDCSPSRSLCYCE